MTAETDAKSIADLSRIFSPNGPVLAARTAAE
jgi:hypothetical protein